MSQLINENISEIVRVENLVKKYVNLTALDNFSFTADRGKILAIVGPDGAGKTSLFRSLCSLIEFDAGEIIINGFNLKTGFEKIKPLLGYMPQIFSLYQD
ncbi:MAG: ATP-binding cassette domain-containing protein, partial [Candidatus Zixiibacteriota bacterium]